MTLRSLALVLVVAALAAGNSGAAPASLAASPKWSNAEARAFARSLFVRSPYRIGREALAGVIEYRIALAPGAAWTWPETGEQRVRRDGDVKVLRICADCGREAAPDAAAMRQYLTANAWVTSDDPAVRHFATAHAFGTNTHARMHALVKAVRARMNGPYDYRTYDSARIALVTRRGDCTEFAVLLAATARAIGIPARVAYGVAYSSRFAEGAHVFTPHMWVQAWDGTRWKSYDAGLETFDAGHIAVFVGDGAPRPAAGVTAVIRRLRLLETAQIRTAPATAR